MPPLNLVGDFGGGGMLLAVGVLSAVLEARVSGRGQVVDAAMVDGAALLTTVQHELRAMGRWSDERGANLTDGGAPFYDTYETADGEFVAVGAMEPEFFAALVTLTGLDPSDADSYLDEARWPGLRAGLAAAFRTRTRDEWAVLAETVDACVAPVLSLADAPGHPYNRARQVFVDVGGWLEPAPAPRFSRTASGPPRPGPRRGQDTDDVLAEAGFSKPEIERLRATGVLR